MNIKSFKHKDWTAQWAGMWSILSFSYWGPFYCRRPFSQHVERFATQTIMSCRKGKTRAYVRTADKKILSKKLEKIVEKNPNFVTKFCQNLQAKADIVLNLISKYIGKDISFKQYAEFQDALVSQYYPYHIENKVIVDYLKPELLKKHMPQLEKTREYIVPVFTKSEQFMTELAKIHSKKINYDPELILSAIKDEFEPYLKYGKKMPSINKLKERYVASDYLFDKKEMEIIIGKKVDLVDKIVFPVSERGVIKGMTAYPGKVKGIVKIVLDSKKAKNFQQGDILVTGMTRPEFLMLMKKSAAIITDAGGLLCHAAITAREIKKPCIIGTQAATKILKDGDRVEVDASAGVVRKLSR